MAGSLTLWQSDRAAPPDVPLWELRLRTADASPVVLQLPAGSSWVGSDTACTFPLPQEGVEATHLLLIHGARRTVARSLGPTSLNGESFDEAELHDGDCLRLGTAELDVLAYPAASTAAADVEPGEQADADSPDADSPDAADEAAVAAGLVALLLDESSALPTDETPGEFSADAAALIQEMAAEDPRPALDDVAAPTAEPTALPANDAPGAPLAQEALEERFARLCEDHDNMARERQRWLGGWNQAEAQLNNCVEQIHRKMGQLRDEHEAAGLELSERRRELLQDHDNLTERFAALDRRLEEFTAQQAAGLVERLAWQEEQRRLHEQLLARSNQIDRKLDALTARQQSMEAKRSHGAAAEGPKPAGYRDAVDFRLAELRAEREALEEDLRLEQAERARTFLSEPTGSAEETAADAVEEEVPILVPEVAPEPAHEEATLADAAEEWPDETEAAAGMEAVGGPPKRDTLTLAELTAAIQTESPAPAADEEQAAEPEAVEAASRAEEIDPATSATPAWPDASEPEEISFAAPVNTAPASTADLFARMGFRPQEDQPSTPVWQAVEARPEVRPAERRAAIEEPAHAERDDDSIENYMARLMDRVRTAGGGSSEAHPASQRRDLEDSRNVPPRPEVPPPAAESPEPPQPRVRVAPPESAANLSAMRELANMNARQALDSHQKRRMSSLMYGKLLLAVVSMVVSFTMIAMAVAGRPLYFFGAMLAATMTGVWSWQYLKLARQLALAAEQSAAAKNGAAATHVAQVILAEAVAEPTSRP